MNTKENIITNQHILFFAFKYSLNRKSSAPSIVMTSIMKNIRSLDNDEIKRYINEIEKCSNFGLDKNQKNWFDLAESLKTEIAMRNF